MSARPAKAVSFRNLVMVGSRAHGLGLLAGAAVAASGPAWAQTAPVPAATCVPFDSAYLQAPLFQIDAAAGSRVNFQTQAKACPATGTCAFKRKGFLTPGDVVLASAPRDGFRCAYYEGANGKISAGFLPEAALKPFDAPKGVDDAFLIGAWKSDDSSATITIKAAGGALQASGHAAYGQNEGAFDKPLKKTGDGFTVTDDICTVTAVRRGPYLAVSDNNSCGGMNVSFGGLYARPMPAR